MIELFCAAYNEEWMLPRMVDFYRFQDPSIIIHVYDNGSTDRTREIAEEKGCFVHHWDTGDEIRDDLLVHFKNTVWKGSKADKVIVCDVDEWVEIPYAAKMKNSAVSGNNWYYTCEGYNMVSGNRGTRYPLEDKVCIFNPKIQSINYSYGAHTARVDGDESPIRPRLFHMKYAMPIEMVIERYKQNAKRLSQFNKDNGLGFHYTFDEDTIRKEYAELLLTSEILR